MNGDSPAEQDENVPDLLQPSTNAYSIKLIAQYLDELIPHVAADPDYVLSLPQTTRIVLTQPSPSGGKFWISLLMETGISIRWGKIGTQGTVKHIPNSQCQRHNPALALKGRVVHKLRNGYDIDPTKTVLP